MLDAVELIAKRASQEVARIEREFRQQAEAVLADSRAKMLDLQVGYERAIADMRERTAGLRDGRDGERGDEGERGLDGPAGRDGLNGRDGDRGEEGLRGPQGERGFGLDDFDTALTDDGHTLVLSFTRGDTTESHEIPLPIGPRGPDGAAGRDGVDGAAGRDGLAGVPGRDGAPGKDGRDGERGLPGESGKDGRGFAVRGLWSAAEAYLANDVVQLNGGSFVALRDAPGDCPGDGWQLWARQGKPGPKGDAGDRGERGERGFSGVTPSLLDARLDAERLTLSLAWSTGDVVEVDFLPMAEAIRANI